MDIINWEAVFIQNCYTVAIINRPKIKVVVTTAIPSLLLDRTLTASTSC
jgi:hypothetical protein